jgi:hypothetical protein
MELESLNAGTESLRWALLLLAPTGFWAGWHLWTSGRTIREDAARCELSRSKLSLTRADTVRARGRTGA